MTPLTDLAVVVSDSPSTGCPPHMSKVGSDGIASPSLSGGHWDGNFNQGAGRLHVALCAEFGNADLAPISGIEATNGTLPCAKGFTRLPGNINSNSSNLVDGDIFLCISRKPAARAMAWLLVSFGLNGCRVGFHAVNVTGSARSQIFDPMGQSPSGGLLLCTAHLPEPCPPPPPPSWHGMPITDLRVAMGWRPELACCPSSYAVVTEAVDNHAQGTVRGRDPRAWSGDFNEGAQGDYVYLCASRAVKAAPISSLVAITTSSAAQPFGDCPKGSAKVLGVGGNSNDLNRRSMNRGAMYLCAARAADRPPIGSLVGRAGNVSDSRCPPMSTAVEGAAAQGRAGRAFDFDPSGVGLRLCAASADSSDTAPGL